MSSCIVLHASADLVDVLLLPVAGGSILRRRSGPKQTGAEALVFHRSLDDEMAELFNAQFLRGFLGLFPNRPAFLLRLSSLGLPFLPYSGVTARALADGVENGDLVLAILAEVIGAVAAVVGDGAARNRDRRLVYLGTLDERSPSAVIDLFEVTNMATLEVTLSALHDCLIEFVVEGSKCGHGMLSGISAAKGVERCEESFRLLRRKDVCPGQSVDNAFPAVL